MLEVLRHGVDEVVGVDPAQLADVVLADELLALRREMDRLDAAFARMAHVAHVRGVGAVDGAGSTAAWLRHRAGMREGDARAAVEAGEVCDLLEQTGTAWRSGEITSGAARTIVGARIEGHDTELVACEPALLDLARRRDLRGLRRAAGHFRNLARGDGSPPGTHDGLCVSRTFDGRLVLDGELTDLAAETVATAIHAYTDPPDPDDPRSPAARRAGAITRICGIALQRVGATCRPGRPGTATQPCLTTVGDGPGPDAPWQIPAGAELGWALAVDHPESGTGRRHRAIPNVSVVLDWQTLTNNTLGAMDGAHTGPIHRHDIERLLCDCTVSRVVTGPDGLPLDVGRHRRTVPPALRRALVARDAGCRYPGCDRPPGWTDAHHVVPWHAGGPTSLDNTLLLCDHHHTIAHQPGWLVKLDGHELRVLRPDGTEVLP